MVEWSGEQVLPIESAMLVWDAGVRWILARAIEGREVVPAL